MDGHQEQNIPRLSADNGLKRIFIANRRVKKVRVLPLCNFNVWASQFVLNLCCFSFCLYWAKFELFALFQFSGAEASFSTCSGICEFQN